MTTENSMYFDTDTFDFFALNDVQETTEPVTKFEGQSKGRPVQSAEQTHFNNEDEPSFELEPEAPKEFDPNADTSDLMNGREEQKQRQDIFFELPDYAMIEVGKDEITGDPIHVSKGDFMDYHSKKKYVEENKAFFEQASKADFEELYNSFAHTATYEKTSIELRMESLQKAIDNPTTDPALRIKYYDELKEEQLKLSAVYQKAGNLREQQQILDDQISQKNLKFTVDTMASRYPQKFKNEAMDILNYLEFNSGLNPKILQRNLTPGLTEMAMKAREWDKYANQNQQKVVKEFETWSRSKPTNTYLDKNERINSKAQKVLNQKGFRNSNEARFAFDHLID